MPTNLHPRLFKRLIAAVYDSFLILATIFIATALTLPFTKGEVAAQNKIYMSLYLLTVIYIFYGWFWTHGGQTLGMRVWKQKLVQLDGSFVTWKQSFIRVITGLPAWSLFFIGLILSIKTNIAESLTNIPAWLFAVSGFVWVLLDNRNNNWRDKLSGTQIVVTD
jgi:uncharacterized RDD family membrane protein YckC